ncbi:hypothetical protein HJG54_12730 [Leptolyngbya sp. NK1-12]|uniref:DUF4280 domain-containing protein n=1 Tax=Leptolyngbya sp. NK1-12 TaxID=2547451 RepID=A0AA96WE51_9CYAN|nr:hypothetical protein [Leptolyngbya sp. NK1-12]WNZ23633.1 hypothetical protein HJG54_12730 [Leptolyngbya sp. NK1-12]
MPAYVLHLGATVACVHGGQGQPAAPNPRVKVMGQPVVTQPIPYTIAGCSNPPTNLGPCVTANWLTGAVRVKVMGQPVLLQTSQAICLPTGTPLNVLITQLRVKAQ